MKPRYLLRKIAHKIFVTTDNDYNLDMATDGEFNLISKLVKKAPLDSVIFDIGAEKGDWAMFVRNLRKDVYIHLFDPFPERSGIRYKRFGDDGRVVINDLAVSNKNGEAAFYPNTYSLHSRESVHRPGQDAIKVKMIRLDDYIKDNNIDEVFFVKMDIEGHEYFALQGAMDNLSKGKIQYIQFEYGSCNIDSRTYLKDFYDLIRDLNYKIAKILPRSIEPVEKYDRLRENFYDSNWLIIRDTGK